MNKKRKFTGKTLAEQQNVKAARCVIYWGKQRKYGHTYMRMCVCVCVPKMCEKKNTHHFNDFNFGFDAQMIEEHFEVFLHLNGIVFHLGHGEDAHFTIFPRTMLFQQEWQQH